MNPLPLTTQIAAFMRRQREKFFPHLNPRWRVSCAANPYDLRPAVSTIVGAIEETLASMPPDEPLFVIMGEDHGHTADKLLQQAVLTHLTTPENRSTFRPALGYEFSHDMPERILKPYLTGNEWKTIQRHNKLGDLNPLIAMTVASDDASCAFTNLFTFAASSNLRTAFNDAVINYGKDPSLSYLNQKDPETRRLITQYAPQELDHRIIARSRTGLYLRNIMIVENALVHAKAAQARVYIQQCGKAHIAGIQNGFYFAPSYFPYKESLMTLFHERQARTLAVITDSGDKFPSELPRKSLPAVNAAGIIIENLAGENFRNTPEGYDREIALIKKIAHNSGHIFDAFNIEALHESCPQMVPAMIKLIANTRSHLSLRFTAPLA